ncbi:potassium transporter TrkG [Mycoplasmopsis felifaucium]|uniref:Potassium transporter TrkG n=1 Tax=Mycoplasmopsis felifaucium TaxID=35768 RepID=A0ABZ2RRS8_9BACT
MKSNKLSRWWRDSKIRAFFKKLWGLRKTGTKIKYIFITYVVVILVCTLFLNSSISHNQDYVNAIGYKKITFADAFFTVCSAFSDTGLVTQQTYIAWNMFGQAIIAFCILIGGLGIFALKIFLINIIFLGGRTSMSDVELVSHERGNSDFFKTKRMIVDSIIFLLIVLILASFGLSFYFYFVSPSTTKNSSYYVLDNVSGTQIINDYISPHKNLSLSIRYGIFHSISALNNAGFDIIGNNSLLPYYSNYSLHIIFIILFVIGGIGYPVIHDFFNFIRVKSKNKNAYYSWNLFSKISVSTYFIATLFGFLFILSFELAAKQNAFLNTNLSPNLYGSKSDRIWALFFTTLSTRSAGFSLFNLYDLSQPSIWVLTLLMFIGAAPASTGGGIRTTTTGILFLSIFSKIFNRPNVRAFKRRIDDDTVKMSAIVATISIFIVLLVSFICMSSLSTFGGQIETAEFGSTHIIFEVVSAFGTTGLTSGVTSKLNVASLLALCAIMFIGQFGISSSVLIWNNKKNSSYKYEYITEAVAIG